MTLNPENDEPTPDEQTTPQTKIEQNDNAPEDTPDPENPDGLINQEDSSDPSDLSDPSPEAKTSEAEADTPDVIFEGDRPLVQELQYQAPRAKAGAHDEEEPAEQSRFQSVAEARAVVEGFLFSSNEPISVARLSKLMGNLHPKTVRGLLLELQWEYDNRGGALQVTEIAGGYQMCTRAFVAPWMFRLHKLKRRSPLSPATLETLAIIAYRQPITKGEIEAIRGVETGAPIRTLQELSLIEASGRREVIGRPQLYITTEQFLKAFGLKGIADLPSISELKSRFAEEQRLKPQKTAVTEQPEVKEEPEAGAETSDIEVFPDDVELRSSEVDDGEIQTGQDVSEAAIDADEKPETIDEADANGSS